MQNKTSIRSFREISFLIYITKIQIQTFKCGCFGQELTIAGSMSIFTCFIFSKSESSAPLASLLLLAAFAL